MKLISFSAARARQIARRNELVEAHLHLVKPIAERVALSLPPSFSLDDLIQSGSLGLIEAADRYRPEEHNGTPFDAWARTKIRGFILDSIRRRHYSENVRPSLDDAPEASMHAGIEECIDRRKAAKEVASLVEELPERKRKVIEMHYRQEMKLSKVGRKIGVCASRASQIHVESITELRKRIRPRPLVAA